MLLYLLLINEWTLYCMYIMEVGYIVRCQRIKVTDDNNLCLLWRKVESSPRNFPKEDYMHARLDKYYFTWEINVYINIYYFLAFCHVRERSTRKQMWDWGNNNRSVVKTARERKATNAVYVIWKQHLASANGKTIAEGNLIRESEMREREKLKAKVSKSPSVNHIIVSSFAEKTHIERLPDAVVTARYCKRSIIYFFDIKNCIIEKNWFFWVLFTTRVYFP